MFTRFNIIKQFLWPIFIFFFQVNLNGQESFSIALNYGNIIEHSPKLQPLLSMIEKPVTGFTVNYSIPNKTGASWRKNYNYPNLGLSYNYKNYGLDDKLGHSHSLTTFLQMSFLRRRKHFDFGFKGFSGLGYFDKKYNANNNSLNKAISSHINISAEARIYTKVRIEPAFLEYSFGINHFSNGLVKAPNLGINVFNNAFNVGVELEEQEQHQKKMLLTEKHNLTGEYWCFISFGIKSVEDDNHNYTFSSFSLNYSRRISAINKIGAGIDFLNDPSLTPAAYLSYHYLGNPDLNFRYGINVHNEFMMGKTGLFTAYGLYLRKSEFYTSRDYYKVGFKHYFNHAIVVIMLRAIPLFRADVIEFGLGFRIGSKN